jgi:hypothetical protein
MNKKYTFEEIYQSPTYALDTLVNGNPSACVEYIRDLIFTDSPAGIQAAGEALALIKNENHPKYDWVASQVFRFYRSVRGNFVAF